MARMNVIGKPVELSTSSVSNDSTIPTTAYVNAASNNPHPTVVATTVEVTSGLYNGDFSVIPPYTAAQTSAGAWIDGTAAGSATNDFYRWWWLSTGGTGSVQFDTTVSYSGNASAKLVSTAGIVEIRSGAPAASYSPTKYNPPVKPNTKYKVSCMMKNTAVTTGACLKAYEFSDTVYLTIVNTTSLITAAADWTYYSTIFTTSANTTRLLIGLYVSDVGTAWFDDVKIEEVIEDTSYTGTIPTPLLSTITGVTSVDSIDQFMITNDATAPIGDDTALEYVQAQGFTPTKSKLTGITFYKEANTGSPTGNFNVSIRTDNSTKPSSTIVASYEYTLAEYNALSTGENFVPLPCLLIPGALYWIVFKDSDSTEATNNRFNIATLTTGTYTGGQHAYSINVESTWTVNAVDIYFKTHFAKNTTNATIVSNGEKLSLSTSSQGLLTGAVIDLDKGKYTYKNSISSTLTATNEHQLTNVYATTAGGSAETLQVINGYTLSSTGTYYYPLSVSGSGTKYYIYKVETLLPIKHITMVTTLYSSTTTAVYMQISLDGLTWTTLRTRTDNTSTATAEVTESDFANNTSVFYVRFYKSGTCQLGGTIESLDIDLDTSVVNLPMIYPLSTNQFSEEVQAQSTVTRIYYRVNKFQNKYGLMVPHLEFTDASDVFIKALPIPIDNSFEASPSINIVVASTTNGQQSGTGSNDSTTGYILNDGEYMTLSTAVATFKVTYKVGTGTTSFGNITKNVIYASSNSCCVSIVEPSSRFGFIYWYHIQSLARTVVDLSQRVNTLITKPETTSTKWIPVTNFNTTAPSTSTISMTADMTATILVGMPLKFVLSEVEYYAVVTAITAGLMTIAGAPLTTTPGALSALYYGDSSRVVQMVINIPGYYEETSYTAEPLMIESLLGMRYGIPWRYTKAYCVQFYAIHRVADTGTAPIINVTIDTTAVSTSNSGNGISMPTNNTTSASTVVDISTGSTYRIQYGEYVELKITKGTDTVKAQDLTVTVVFVLH